MCAYTLNILSTSTYILLFVYTYIHKYRSASSAGEYTHQKSPQIVSASLFLRQTQRSNPSLGRLASL